MMKKMIGFVMSCVVLTLGLSAFANINNWNDYTFHEQDWYDNYDPDGSSGGHRDLDRHDMVFNFTSQVGTTEIMFVGASNGNSSSNNKKTDLFGGGWSAVAYGGSDDKSAEIFWRQVTASNVNDPGDCDAKGAYANFGIVVYPGYLTPGQDADKKLSSDKPNLNNNGSGPWLILVTTDNGKGNDVPASNNDQEEFFTKRDDRCSIYLTDDKTFNDNNYFSVRGAICSIEVIDSGGGGPTAQPPTFIADPVVKTDAVVGDVYDRSVLSSATDPDGDEPVFTIESGPSWLTMTSSKRIGGTPTSGDIGLNTFTLRATDPGGLYDEATLQVTVVDVGSTLGVNLATSGNRIADVGGLQTGKEIGFIDDGDTGTPTAKGGGDIWVEYDFGGNYALNSAKIFGDDGGTWYSASWTLQTWNGSSYVDAFSSVACNGAQWYEQALDVTTSKAKVIIHQGTNGAEVFELEIWGEAAGGGGSQSGIIAAWDFASEETDAVASGWTTWASSSITNIAAQSTVSGLTLTHTAGSGASKLSSSTTLTTTSAAPLLTANAGVWNDYLRTETTQTLTLSGLTSGQTYKFQFVGHCKTSTNGTRNVEVIMNSGSPVNLFDPVGTTGGDEASYSPYLSLTSTGSDVTFVFNKISSGANSGICGMIVEGQVSSSNAPPTWNSSPVVKSAGDENVVYSGSLSGDATDPDEDTLVFVKTGGAAWLQIASDGTLSGTPDVAGLNTATVAVSDGVNVSVSVTVQIAVYAAPLEGYEAWASANSVDVNDVENLIEYALDGDAGTKGDSEPVLTRNGSDLEFHFTQRNDDSSLVYVVEWATDLESANWSDSGTIAVPVETNGTFNTVKHVVPSGLSHGYFRLRVTNP